MGTIISNLNSVSDAIGWMLIHFLWQGTILFMTYWLLTRIIFKNNINVQYWLGIIIISLCLIIPVRELFIQIQIPNNTNVIHQIIVKLNIVNTSGILNSTDLLISLIQKIIPYLVMIWVVSVTLISTHLFKSWSTLVKLSKKPSLSIPLYLSNKLNFTSKFLKLKFQPIINISQKVVIPATFGFFKPIILIPISLINKLPQEQMEAILLHELCHIKRADFIYNVMQLLVETIFFYHPLTKWISNDIRITREKCCDQMVLGFNENRLVYAKALTSIAEYQYNCKSNSFENSHLQIAASDGELFNRIKSLMSEHRSKANYFNLKLTSVLFLGLVITLNNLNYKSSSINSQLLNTNIDNQKSNMNKTKQTKPLYETPNLFKIIKLKSYVEPKKINQKPIKSISISQNIIKIENNHSISKNKPLQIFLPDKTTIRKARKTDVENVEQIPLTITNKVKNESVKYLAPKVIKKVYPNYNKNLQKLGIEGSVSLSFTINNKGKVKNISLVNSTTVKKLEKNAVSALKKWRFDSTNIQKNHRYIQTFDFKINTNKCNIIDISTGTRIKKMRSFECI